MLAAFVDWRKRGPCLVPYLVSASLVGEGHQRNIEPRPAEERGDRDGGEDDADSVVDNQGRDQVDRSNQSHREDDGAHDGDSNRYVEMPG